MVRYVVKCRACGAEFEHDLTWTDVFRPHIFNELTFKCPKCGKTEFDTLQRE